jgi:hypothetical protein
LVDVFALLTEARERIAANVKAIEAKQNFWLADTDLNAAMLGGGGSGGENTSAMVVSD